MRFVLCLCGSLPPCLPLRIVREMCASVCVCDGVSAQVLLSSGLDFRPASPETSVTSVRIEGIIVFTAGMMPRPVLTSDAAPRSGHGPSL